jgi:hypothetical protein
MERRMGAPSTRQELTDQRRDTFGVREMGIVTVTVQREDEKNNLRVKLGAVK